MSGLAQIFIKKLQNFKGKKADENQSILPENNDKKQSVLGKKLDKDELIGFINQVSKRTEGIFKTTQPKVYSMAEENNISCKYDENCLATRDGNLCMGIKLEGYSYAASNAQEELDLSEARNRFWNRLDTNLEMNIICKKEMIEIENDNSTVTNPYAREIIDKWDKKQTAYKISYYLIFSTKNKTITGFFESLRDKTTQEKEKKEESEQQKIKYHLKFKKLKELEASLNNDLASFNPRLLSSDELLNIFASYANMQPTHLKYSYDLITDCYLTSNVEFKKDYMIFERNDSTTTYARFLSVKAYETDYISSIIASSILQENTEFMIFIHCEAVPKDKAIKKVKDTKALAVDFVREELDEFIQFLQSDRESLILVSFSVLVTASDLEELNEKSDILKGLLENQSLSVVKETLNQKPLFFSFFPSRGNLNARVRTLQGRNLSTMINFENDILGFRRSVWGNAPITILKHLSGSPFLFNLHDSENEGAVGHTLIIGGTGYGKTTFMEFLMTNLYRYDINIFAMDKLRGMHNFTNFLDGEYHDMDLGEFKLNPFSLANTDENNSFLETWLCKMGGIDIDKETELAQIVQDTIKSLRIVQTSNEEYVPSLDDFYKSLRLPNDDEIRPKFKKYLNSIFDNKEDALNFKRQMSIINMDSILKDTKLASLSALYLFHKIKNLSKQNAKGFFIFIDELKDYLLDDTMRESIIEAILEIRKINGVITMGLQNIDFFKDMPKADSLISSMANYIIFPTSTPQTLEMLEHKLKLSGSEIDFLKNCPKESRMILFKQVSQSKSAVLDINLSRLGEHLRVYSSNASDVKMLLKLKSTYPAEWRQRYLKRLI